MISITSTHRLAAAQNQLEAKIDTMVGAVNGRVDEVAARVEKMSKQLDLVVQLLQAKA